MRLVKVLFVLEVLILAGRYVKGQVEVRVTEREVTEIPMGENEEVFGIGIGSEDGEVFWFHRSREVMEENGRN